MDITRSLMMQERARQRIPGMTQLLSKRPDMFAPGVWPGSWGLARLL
jgi:glutamate-1-semialdehyde 2,1-aminomutase